MRYFAYGSNMFTERLEARVSTARNPRKCVLHGHRLRFHKRSVDGSGKCSIVRTESASDVVHGVVFEIEDRWIAALDREEGVGLNAQRVEIAISLDGCESTAAVYRAEPGSIDESLVPYRWYYDLVIAGALQHALPSDYVAALRAVPYRPDPKADRESRLHALKLLKDFRELPPP